MTTTQVAELSRFLFSPVTFLLYVAAMASYLYAMAFTRVDRSSDEAAIAGTRATRLATALTIAGLATHLGHLVTRSIAAGGRVPWGNMFEFSSVMGFGVVLAGVVIFQWRLRRPEVMGFLLIGALLTMGTALLVYTEPGPLMPILNSQWLKIHVFMIMLGATVFTVGFVFNALHLLRDTAERRVAAQTDASAIGSTVGAAYAGPSTPVATPPLNERVDGRSDDGDDEDISLIPETRYPGDMAIGGVRGPSEVEGDDDDAYGRALRAAISPLRLSLWTGGITLIFSLVFQRPSASVSLPLLAIGAALIAWQFLPSLPPAATLDSLAYRTISFGFPIWTFAVLAGAVWAEQSWGRYWGWDPKETSAFLTWVAYAAYLHARATRGMRGRKAAIIGMVAFAVLLFTYFVVNLLVAGLHSYAGTNI